MDSLTLPLGMLIPANTLLVDVHQELRLALKPGISPNELDRVFAGRDAGQLLEQAAPGSLVTAQISSYDTQP